MEKERAMPRSPKVPCGHPGCPNLVEPGKKFCTVHLKEHNEYTRPPSDRGYNYEWRKASKLFLKQNPLCAICLKKGRLTAATVVDHIIPHRGDKALFWDKSNWQALCKPCHDDKTLSEETNPIYKY